MGEKGDGGDPVVISGQFITFFLQCELLYLVLQPLLEFCDFDEDERFQRGARAGEQTHILETSLAGKTVIARAHASGGTHLCVPHHVTPFETL